MAKCVVLMGSLVFHALYGLNGSGWFRAEPQVMWALLIVFSTLAGWFDLRQRRIPNEWNLGCLLIVLVIQSLFTSVPEALFAGAAMAILMLPPTLLCLWGQGDWKMSIVYGTALGVLPGLFVWLIGWVIAKAGRGITAQISLRYMELEMARSIPVATFMAVSTALCYLVFTARSLL